MNEPTASPTSSSPRRRLALAGIGLLGAAAIAVAVAATSAAARQSALRRDEPARARLSDHLARTIDAAGIDAAMAELGALRAEGFPGFAESEGDTNRLGYTLLRKGETRAAIRLFALNVELHPDSANVHDSLGEALLAAGDEAAAIASYRRAVAIDPRMKSAGTALARLTDYRRPPYRPMLFVHIAAGGLGIVAGAAAALLRKGSRRHALAGDLFTVAMLTMSASAVFVAATTKDGAVINLFMGGLTFYLVATSWRTARQRDGAAEPLDAALFPVGLAAAAGLWFHGIAAALTPNSTKDGIPATIYLAFGTVALGALLGDLRRAWVGARPGVPRLVRHLWRMCAALFIAVSSFFLGQPQVFPAALRDSGLLSAPPLLVVLLLLFWLVRLRFPNRFARRAAPTPGGAVGQPTAG